jgi:leader peptidase (prepilin peptidase)/N-methyltransferase
MPLALLPAAAFGLIIGSFLNVVAHRLPSGKSLATPGSQCPSCEAPVKPLDNIPLLSWLVLRGRCRNCAEPIAKRYPLVEALTAALFAAVVAVHHDSATMLVLGLVLVAFLVPIALIDLDLRIIPNKLTLPAAILAVGLGTALDPGGEIERLVAGVAAARGGDGRREAARRARPVPRPRRRARVLRRLGRRDGGRHRRCRAQGDDGGA